MPIGKELDSMSTTNIQKMDHYSAKWQATFQMNTTFTSEDLFTLTGRRLTIFEHPKYRLWDSPGVFPNLVYQNMTNMNHHHVKETIHIPHSQITLGLQTR